MHMFPMGSVPADPYSFCTQSMFQKNFSLLTELLGRTTIACFKDRFYNYSMINVLHLWYVLLCIPGKSLARIGGVAKTNHVNPRMDLISTNLYG